MKNKNVEIKQLINNTFLCFDKITIKDLETFNLIDKLDKLDVNTSKFKQAIKEQGDLRLHSLRDGTNYDCLAILNNELKYIVYHESLSFQDLKKVKLKFNLINFDYIENLIKYKDNSIELKDFVETIKQIK